LGSSSRSRGCSPRCTLLLAAARFYVLQLLESGGQLLLFTRYGRVGEVGKPETKTNATAKDFEKKYRSKTKNAWKGASDPDFVKKPGSYDLMEMDLDDDLPEGLDEPAAGGAAAAAVAACTLEPRVKEFVKLIFDHDMFKSQMESTFKLDTSKLPLGKLSKAQLDKGMAVLSEIEDALPRGNRATLIELTSRFYTVIPHASNRATILPVIDTAEGLQTKRDMVSALGDIEAALAMQKNADATGDVEAHPLDKAYSSMATDLQAVTKSSKEFKLIKTFAENTKTPENFGGWMTGSTVRREILEVFKVDRKEEGARFAKHSKLGNRKLLWHGTNVAVVAAIMKSVRQKNRRAPHAIEQRWIFSFLCLTGVVVARTGAADHASLRGPCRQGHLSRLRK
jgi:poly [ADP-ribose] polymerase